MPDVEKKQFQKLLVFNTTNSAKIVFVICNLLIDEYMRVFIFAKLKSWLKLRLIRVYRQSSVLYFLETNLKSFKIHTRSNITNS